MLLDFIAPGIPGAERKKMIIRIKTNFSTEITDGYINQGSMYNPIAIVTEGFVSASVTFCAITPTGDLLPEKIAAVAGTNQENCGVYALNADASMVKIPGSLTFWIKLTDTNGYTNTTSKNTISVRRVTPSMEDEPPANAWENIQNIQNQYLNFAMYELLLLLHPKLQILLFFSSINL